MLTQVRWASEVARHALLRAAHDPAGEERPGKLSQEIYGLACSSAGAEPRQHDGGIEMTTRKQWICTTIDTPGGKRVEGSPTNAVPMGMADRSKLWDKGASLKVRFMQGEPALHARVLAAARSWLAPGIRIDLTQAKPDEAAQIRVAFDPNGGSWSYIGRDNLSILPGQPTMNLGWVALDTPQISNSLHFF